MDPRTAPPIPGLIIQPGVTRTGQLPRRELAHRAGLAGSALARSLIESWQAAQARAGLQAQPLEGRLPSMVRRHGS